MRVVNGVTITTVVSVKLAYGRTGGNWFSQDSMRFWGTKVFNAVYGDRYFITEDDTFDGSRASSIRELKDDGSIDTVAFQHYTTPSDAAKAAMIIALRTA